MQARFDRASTASARRPHSYRAGSRQVRRLRWLLVSFNFELQAAKWFHERNERRAELDTRCRPYGPIKNRANFGFSAPSVLPRPHAQGPVSLCGNVAHNNCWHIGLLEYSNDITYGVMISMDEAE